MCPVAVPQATGLSVAAGYSPSLALLPVVYHSGLTNVKIQISIFSANSAFSASFLELEALTVQKTIIQQIQPNCDSLYKNIKLAKESLHKTNKELADETGVALSTISKFFSGASSAPCVFNVSALCICLGISLDELMGIRQPTESPPEQELSELRLKLQSADEQLSLLRHHNAQLTAGLEERRPILKNISALATMLLCTSVLSILLSVALALYLIADISNTQLGFFTEAKQNRIYGIFALICLVVCTAVLFAVMIKAVQNRRVKGGKGHA